MYSGEREVTALLVMVETWTKLFLYCAILIVELLYVVVQLKVQFLKSFSV